MSPPLARRAFTRLLRAVRRSFAGDAAAIAAGRAEALRVFRANAHEADARRIDKMVAEAHDAADFLQESVVQARLNDAGVYEMKVPSAKDGNVAVQSSADASAGAKDGAKDGCGTKSCGCA